MSRNKFDLLYKMLSQYRLISLVQMKLLAVTLKKLAVFSFFRLKFIYSNNTLYLSIYE